MQKQMKYANDRNIPYVIIIGSDEIETGLFSLKNMVSGEQEKLRIQNLIEKFS